MLTINCWNNQRPSEHPEVWALGHLLTIPCRFCVAFPLFIAVRDTCMKKGVCFLGVPNLQRFLFPA